MQVFVPYPSPIDVAKCLDRNRLAKQCLECGQILAAIDGKTDAWKNHPVTKMYKEHKEWLKRYEWCLASYLYGKFDKARDWDVYAYMYTPPFLTKYFCDQHKRRLYTKAPELYPQFAEYGKSDENWYFVDGKIVKYVNGKRTK